MSYRISLAPASHEKDNAKSLCPNEFLSFLRELEQKDPPKTQIVVVLFNSDRTDYRELLTDKMWGRIEYKGDNVFGSSNDSSGYDDSPESRFRFRSGT